MSLQQYLRNASTESLAQLKSDLVDASLAFSLKKDWRKPLKARRSTSKGGMKKIYSAMAKAEKQEILNIIDILTQG